MEQRRLRLCSKLNIEEALVAYRPYNRHLRDNGNVRIIMVSEVSSLIVEGMCALCTAQLNFFIPVKFKRYFINSATATRH